MNFFKAFAAILLLVAFAAQTFSQGLIVLNYYVNTEAFASNCENKTRPSMHCLGKCQMAKEFKKEEQKNDQNTDRKLTNKTDVISSKSFFTTLSHTDDFIPSHPHSSYSSFSLGTIPDDIFHPPS